MEKAARDERRSRRVTLPMKRCENCNRFFAGAEKAVGVCGKTGAVVWRRMTVCAAAGR